MWILPGFFILRWYDRWIERPHRKFRLVKLNQIVFGGQKIYDILVSHLKASIERRLKSSLLNDSRHAASLSKTNFQVKNRKWKLTISDEIVVSYPYTKYTNPPLLPSINSHTICKSIQFLFATRLMLVWLFLHDTSNIAVIYLPLRDK